MLFKLLNGTTVIPVKKCHCKDHTGPHWIYLDRKWKQDNQKIKGINQTVAELKRIKRFERIKQENGVLEIFLGINE